MQTTEATTATLTTGSNSVMTTSSASGILGGINTATTTGLLHSFGSSGLYMSTSFHTNVVSPNDAGIMTPAPTISIGDTQMIDSFSGLDGDDELDPEMPTDDIFDFFDVSLLKHLNIGYQLIVTIRNRQVL
jgi:hypothetical protein